MRLKHWYMIHYFHCIRQELYDSRNVWFPLARFLTFLSLQTRSVRCFFFGISADFPPNRTGWNCRLGWAELRKAMLVFQTYSTFYVVISIRNIAKPNIILPYFRVPYFRVPYRKSVGFHSPSGWNDVSGKSFVSLWFLRFWWHPFNPTYDNWKLKIFRMKIKNLIG